MAPKRATTIISGMEVAKGKGHSWYPAQGRVRIVFFFPLEAANLGWFVLVDQSAMHVISST